MMTTMKTRRQDDPRKLKTTPDQVVTDPQSKPNPPVRVPNPTPYEPEKGEPLA